MEPLLEFVQLALAGAWIVLLVIIILDVKGRI